MLYWYGAPLSVTLASVALDAFCKLMTAPLIRLLRVVPDTVSLRLKKMTDDTFENAAPRSSCHHSGGEPAAVEAKVHTLPSLPKDARLPVPLVSKPLQNGPPDRHAPEQVFD